jgi:hypothetical protein
MIAEWAVCLENADTASVRSLWRLPHVEVCAQPGTLWLRGLKLDETGQRHLRTLPGARCFTVMPDGQLLPPGSLVPRGRLPEASWTPLKRWLKVALPVPALAGRFAQSVRLHLVRASEDQNRHELGMELEPSVLLTSIERWAQYALDAPQARLDRWLFALCKDGRVLVRGSPLPPIRGRLMTEEDGIFIPAGWTWSPAAPAAVVRRVFGLRAGEMALWLADDAWERLIAADFKAAARSAVRLSREGLAGNE